MPRYIDADALIDDLLSYAEANEGTYHAEGFKNAVTVVEDQPTADVVERKTGKWIREPNCFYRCSECGKHYPSIRDNMEFGFCPNCGAEME